MKPPPVIQAYLRLEREAGGLHMVDPKGVLARAAEECDMTYEAAREAYRAWWAGTGGVG
jgi:hypothetical protein